MPTVRLLNRSYLEQQLEALDLKPWSDVLIDRLKEHVTAISTNLYEMLVIETQLLVKEVLHTVKVHFNVNEDASEDDEQENVVNVEFVALEEMDE